MKKAKLFSILMLAILISPFVVRAEDGSGKHDGGMWQERKDDMKNDWQERKDKWKEARDEWQNARPEHRFEMRKHLAGVFFERFDFAGKFLQSMHDRIENWLDKARDEKGISGNDAEKYLDDAQVKITAVKNKAADIKVTLEEEADTDAEKTEKKDEVKKGLEEIKALVKDAHELLKKAFQSIREEVKALHDDNDDSDDDNDDDNN